MESQPPRVLRSPRLVPPLPSDQVELPAPPPPPAAPQISPTSLLFSLIPGLMGALITYLITHRSTYLLFSLPMMLTGLLVQGALYLFQRDRYVKAVAARTDAYQGRLAELASTARTLAEQQRRIMVDLAPDSQACLARANPQEPRLWERQPGDADFLRLRLGTGPGKVSFQVIPPKSYGNNEPDPLIQAAEELAGQAQSVKDLPIGLSLPSVAATGMVGPRDLLLAAARAIVLQVAVHHAPEEVQIGALFPSGEAADWLSLRWLPHTWTEEPSRRLLAATPEGARDLLSWVQGLLERRRSNGDEAHLLLIVGAGELAPDHPAWPLLLREGSACGIHLLFLAERRESLPARVEAILSYQSEQAAELILTEPHLTTQGFLPDLIDLPALDGAARRLAPVRLGDQRSGSVPSRVDLLSLFGAEQLESWDLTATWANSRPWESLSVPLGLGAGGAPVRLDLHERGDGPHGLAAGATGSGKSELLQTLIAALALRFHPQEVALLLVDYKGGGMANAFAGLPHLVGVITNLEGGQTRRALASLRAELRRRQRLLAEAGLNHVDAYLRLRRAEPEREPLPHLIVIVDEFAELKAEQPEFMRELVSAVRVGRSLGVHLLLATQKPAGVIDEQIWSNARFRLCLRVERREDSQEVLKSPVAASLDRPGLCWLQVGSGERMVQFQAGWGGAPYRPATDSLPPISISEVTLEGVRVPLVQPPAPPTEAPSQLASLVEFIRREAAAAGIEPVRSPWLPPLPEALPLDQLLAGDRQARWAEALVALNPVIGLLDDPEAQSQRPLHLPLTKAGHLAVVGAPGSGKSTFLQSLALSMAESYSPDQVHLYILDGAGRTHLPLAGLPHTGAVILGDDAERLRRLGRFLQEELLRRKERIAEAGAGTWAGFRQISGERLPALVVTIDNLPALLASQPDWEELLALLGREGGAFGLHLVLTLPGWTTVRARLLSSIGLAVALPLHDRTEYPAIVGRTNGLVPAGAPGRGLVRGEPPLEFQTALPSTGATEWERQSGLQVRIAQLAESWGGARPHPIRSLPAVISLRELLAEPPAQGAPIGLEVESLAPFRLDLREGPHLLVAGTPGSGKSSLLAGILSAMAAQNREVAPFLIDLTGAALSLVQGIPHLVSATDPTAAVALIERLVAGRPAATTLLLIDDFDLVREALPSAARDRLEALVRRERSSGLHLIVSGGTAAFSSGYDGLTKALRELQTGFLLGTADPAEGALFGVRLPAPEGNRFLPVGQGFYIRRGRIRPVKAALPDLVWRADAQIEEEEHESDPGRSGHTSVPGLPVR